MISPRQAIPSSWSTHLTGGRLTLGMDVGTTANTTSNPSVLAVLERVDHRFLARLVVAWKTDRPEVSDAILDLILSDIQAVRKNPTVLAIDGSSERFFVQRTQRRLAGRIRVLPIAGGQKLTYQGHQDNAKTLLGNLYVAALSDGLIALPPQDFITTDHRLVKRDRGGFSNDLGKGGWHGDTFDALKLAYWAQIRNTSNTQDIAATPISDSTKKTDRLGRRVLDAIRRFTT